MHHHRIFLSEPAAHRSYAAPLKRSGSQPLWHLGHQTAFKNADMSTKKQLCMFPNIVRKLFSISKVEVSGCVSIHAFMVDYSKNYKISRNGAISLCKRVGFDLQGPLFASTAHTLFQKIWSYTFTLKYMCLRNKKSFKNFLSSLVSY